LKPQIPQQIPKLANPEITLNRSFGQMPTNLLHQLHVCVELNPCSADELDHVWEDLHASKGVEASGSELDPFSFLFFSF
jgi:hypothetical protein